jgi:hypothetical protein
MVENRLNLHYGIGFPVAGPQNRFDASFTLSIWNRLQQSWFQNEGPPLVRRNLHDAACAGLVPERRARCQKNEGQDEPDHDVILPARARVVPEQKSFHSSHLPAGHMTLILTCGLRIVPGGTDGDCGVRYTYISNRSDGESWDPGPGDFRSFVALTWQEADVREGRCPILCGYYWRRTIPPMCT